MATPEDLERIEWCKFELADFKRKGQEGYSGDYIRAREKELYELTTPLPKKIADKQEQLASLKKRTIIKSYDDGLYESRLERKIAEMKRKEKGESSPTVSSGSPTSRAVAPTIVFQGGGVAQPRGLHTHTIQEIIQKAKQPDPTAPYFDTNSDHMRVINPLEPHYDLSGDFPKLVTPLKPGLKISGPA